MSVIGLVASLAMLLPASPSAAASLADVPVPGASPPAARAAPWVTAPSAARAAPRFRAAVSRIDRRTRDRMTGVSWRPGCPVPLRRLRLVRVTHWGFDGEVHRGRLVLNAAVARGMVGVMEGLFERRYPIRRMRLVDAYGANDRRSMRADNTSAFNCREVAGRPGVWSEHAFGRAIDLNPVENPYVTPSGYVSPPAGAPYADRDRHRPGMVHRGGHVVAAFARAGWRWGGDWEGTKDYQHFSTGR